VIFDLDGTLIDSRPTLCTSLNEVLHARDLRPLTEAEVQACMGGGLAGLVASALHRVGSDLPVAPLLAQLRERYDVHSARSVRPFAGVDAALDALGRTHRLALCTNKPRAPTDAVLHRLGWNKRFEAVAALGDAPLPKPDPALLQRVLDMMHIGPDAAVLVGDTRNDAGAAAALGMRFFAVAWGYAQGPPGDLGAEAVLSDLSALRAWL
jgi:phosphoglycolate phosphatase